MSETTERSAYDKLSLQRKQLADMLVANLDSGGLWKQGWRTRGAPENAVTGKKYRGVNNLYLFLVAMERGYSDNRCRLIPVLYGTERIYEVLRIFIYLVFEFLYPCPRVPV